MSDYHQADDLPLFRSTDPATSREGAEHIKPTISGLRAEFLQRLARIQPATAEEVAGGDASIRKRRSELIKAGRIRVVGRRRCQVTGNNAQTLEITC